MNCVYCKDRKKNGGRGNLKKVCRYVRVRPLVKVVKQVNKSQYYFISASVAAPILKCLDYQP